MASGFRPNVFDPVLIIAQIIALQCLYYVSMGLWITLSDIIGGVQISVDQIFDYKVSWNYSCPSEVLVRDFVLPLNGSFREPTMDGW